MMKYRYSFQDIQANAQYRWQSILAHIGMNEASLKNKHQPCPMCGGKDRFRFDDKDGHGTYFCNQCGAGNGFTLVQKFLNLGDFGNAVTLVAQILGMGETGSHHKFIAREPAKTTTPQTPPKDELSKLLNIWEKAKPIIGTPAEQYLLARGISSVPNSPNLRFHGALPYWHDGVCLGEFGALLGLMHDTQGEIMGIQRIYLSQHHGTWQKLKPTFKNIYLDAKKQMARYPSSTRGTAVHIDEPSPNGFLLVAEGIETALASRELFGGVPTWATVNAGNMARLVLPDGLKRLLIVADNDHSETGYCSAHDLGIRAIKQGIKVQIWQPETIGHDALDELNKRKSSAYQMYQAQAKRKPSHEITQAFINQAN